MRTLRQLRIDADADVTAPFARMAPIIAESVKRHAVDGVVTPATRARVLADLDREMNAFLPVARGARSTLEETIVRHATNASAEVLGGTVARIERVLRGEPKLLNRMRRGRTNT